VNFHSPQVADDSLRAVIDTVLNRPEYGWDQPARHTNWLLQLFQNFAAWLDSLRTQSPGLFSLFVWGLLAVLLLILVHGGWVMYRTVRGASASGSREAAPSRVAVRDARWYQQQADRLAALGHYADAMQAAFISLVLRLDARELLRYHPSKTPREYAREANLQAAEKSRLGDSVRALYACVYAGAPCTAITYREWLGDLESEWHAGSH